MSNSPCTYIQRLGGTELIKDYLSESSVLKPFITDFPSYEAINEGVLGRDFGSDRRLRLHHAIEQQYARTGQSAPQSWEKVKDANTFTITTGHQLNLFGGPKYFIYKIVSVIKTAKRLNEMQDKHVFLPIFWMASEDHDFEEINQVSVFGEEIKASQSYTGPVGRLKPHIFEEAFSALKEVLGTSKEAHELISAFDQAFKQGNWADFTRSWVQELFGDEIVIVDGDDATLKELFLPIIEREFKEQVVDTFVSRTSEELESLGYHRQVNHRSINLFYIEDGIRERIDVVNNSYKIHNQDIDLSDEDVASRPERISPNALMRPVYQELILPNAAYIGGPGELAYWFQLKPLFQELGVSFPILVLRDSFLFVREKDLKLLDELGMSLEDLQQREDDLQKAYISKNGLKQVDFKDEQAQLQAIAAQLMNKAGDLHRDYRSMIEAEKTRMEKFIAKLELRAMRDAKFREEVNIKKLLKLRSTYFPGGGLVERSSSFMEEYLLLGKTPYFKSLMDSSDVMDSRIKVITVNK